MKLGVRMVCWVKDTFHKSGLTYADRPHALGRNPGRREAGVEGSMLAWTLGCVAPKIPPTVAMSTCHALSS